MFGIRTKFQRIKYRLNNQHNFTNIKRYVPISNIKVGKGTYGTIDVKLYGGTNSKLYIGNYCSIASECIFLLGGEHGYTTISTFPFKAKYMNQGEAKTKGDIVIEDDVWLGHGCTILSGAKIGQGAIIGARSVVSKDIPPYAIYAGNRIIKYRFSQEIIEKLLKIDFSKINEDVIKNKINILYEEITENNIDDILNSLNEIT